MIRAVRIGTWNVEGRWTPPRHSELIDRLDCDVLLLTEVSDRLELPGYSVHLTTTAMTLRKTWAAVASRGALEPLPEPHFATAMAVSLGWTFASSVLPWRGGYTELYGQGRHVDKTVRTVDALLEVFPREHVVWGGDWNHALEGPERAGSMGGRRAILSALSTLELRVPTASLPHRLDHLLSIDHIALPASLHVVRVERVSAVGLSDHDAYVVEVEI